jgi:hypothetical protein
MELDINKIALEIVTKMRSDFRAANERLRSKANPLIVNITAEELTKGCINTTRNKIEEERRDNGERVYSSFIAKEVSNTPYMEFTSEFDKNIEDEIEDYCIEYSDYDNYYDVVGAVYDLYMKQFNEVCDKTI